MTLNVKAHEGTGLVEIYDGDKPVAGPFTPDEAAAWVENQTKPKETLEAEEEEAEEEFNPVGIL